MVDNNWRRHPKGDGDGGKFAPEVGSESTVELVGDQVDYQPDGSKAFEERSRKSIGKATEPSSESAVELSDESVSLESDAAAFEKEFGVRATEPDPWVKRSPDVPGPVSASPAPIKLGGVEESQLGTWNYPPNVSISTDEMAHFWATVKLHDSTISAIELADRWGRDLNAAHQHDEERKKQLIHPYGWSSRRKRKDPEGFARDQALRKTFRLEEDWVSAHVGIIYKGDYRDIVRIGAYWAQIGFLDEARGGEPGRVLFETSGGEKVTAPEIWNKYRLWEIKDAWFGRRKYGPPN